MFLPGDLSAMLPRSCNTAFLTNGDAAQGSPDVARFSRLGSASAEKIADSVPRDAPSGPGGVYEHRTVQEEFDADN